MTLSFLSISKTQKPSIPSLGGILAPKGSRQNLFLDLILEDEAEISDLLQYTLSKWSLNAQPEPRTFGEE
ncbi:hypothetical protein VP01_1925g1 [Puccinia sorghi]|uniref:Uncharacterized protein n=1 Tax=Puccinia sorghi TaxID=27349 RepID=A0A0L6VCJ3_9BASI|nr:hypothetical protein VP01_1925g1 [Puccinia sorghi]